MGMRWICFENHIIQTKFVGCSTNLILIFVGVLCEFNKCISETINCRINIIPSTVKGCIKDTTNYFKKAIAQMRAS